MTKKKTKIQIVKGFFTSKIVWGRIMMTIALVGMIAFIILSDNSFKANKDGLSCDNKSKVNVEYKK